MPSAQLQVAPEPTTILGGLFGWWKKRKLKSEDPTMFEQTQPYQAEPVSLFQSMQRTNVDAPPVTALGTAAAAAAPFAEALFAAAAPLPRPEPAAFPGDLP